MNKLEYEMNEVAKRAAEKAIKEAKIVDAKKVYWLCQKSWY